MKEHKRSAQRSLSNAGHALYHGQYPGCDVRVLQDVVVEETR